MNSAMSNGELEIIDRIAIWVTVMAMMMKMVTTMVLDQVAAVLLGMEKMPAID